METTRRLPIPKASKLSRARQLRQAEGNKSLKLITSFFGKNNEKPTSQTEASRSPPKLRGILKKAHDSSFAEPKQPFDTSEEKDDAANQLEGAEGTSHVIEASIIQADNTKINMVISVKTSPASKSSPHKLNKRQALRGSSPSPKRVVFLTSSDEENNQGSDAKRKNHMTKIKAARKSGSVVRNLLPVLADQAILMNEGCSEETDDQGSSISTVQSVETQSKQLKEHRFSMVTGTAERLAKTATGPIKEDEFDDLMMLEIFDNMSESEHSDSHSPLVFTDQKFSKLMQYKVENVEFSNVKRELHLSLTSPVNGPIKTCVLQGSWINTHVKEGDTVNIFFPSVTSHVIINDIAGLIVVNPDHLMSITTLMSSLICMRKSILQEKFRGWEPGNLLMLTGSLVHQLFQEVVKHNIVSEEQMLNIAKDLMKQSANINEIFSQNLSVEEVMKNVESYIPHIKSWMEWYVLSSTPVITNRDEWKKSKSLWSRSPDEKVQVMSVRDIEDNIWCPAYGLKGKIDLTVEVKIQRGRRISTEVIPLELKTGRPSFSFEHGGQVMLYSMMMANGLVEFVDGLLLYLKDGPRMNWVQLNQHHLHSLVQLRNEVAYYQNTTVQYSPEGSDIELSKLPEPISNRHICQGCSSLLSCCLYQKAIENYRPTNPSHPMVMLMPEVLADLSKAHLAYFRKWCTLLHLETQASKSPSDAFWNEDSSSREKKGTCFSGMVLAALENSDSQLVGETYLHRFIKSPTKNEGSVSLKETGLAVNDRVAVSSDSGLDEVAMAFGVILSITERDVLVSLDCDLQRKPNWKNMIFRLDQVTSHSSFSLQLTNLLRLMSPTTEASWLRQLIIDKRAPEFIRYQSKHVIIKGRQVLKKLNRSQQRAILKTTMAQDYLLIKGMPGTGKTSTIVALVTLLVELGHSVLLTSYTHSAVDNILLKLKENEVDFIRLGSLSRIHVELHAYASETLVKTITDVKKLEEFYNSKPVVATTCLGTNHALFSRRKFDYCIVDEASQILQTACLGPLFLAKRFVLVGDPMQLPPVVKSDEARFLGMDESLFAALQQPENTTDLSTQYRMNREIMFLANKLIYNDVLTCGIESVANKTLNLPHSEEVLKDFSSDTWIANVIRSSIQHSVIFLNVDNTSAVEGNDGQGFTNEIEANVVIKLSQVFMESGLPLEQIGIISPYQKQVMLIRKKLKSTGNQSIEVNTIDQYQGRDKEVVMISFVRNIKKDKNMEGGILTDERRLNVAITRAKVKLIMIGSISTLQRYKPLQKLISILRDDQILTLPPDVCHC